MNRMKEFIGARLTHDSFHRVSHEILNEILATPPAVLKLGTLTPLYADAIRHLGRLIQIQRQADVLTAATTNEDTRTTEDARTTEDTRTTGNNATNAATCITLRPAARYTDCLDLVRRQVLNAYQRIADHINALAEREDTSPRPGIMKADLALFILRVNTLTDRYATAIARQSRLQMAETEQKQPAGKKKKTAAKGSRKQAAKGSRKQAEKEGRKQSEKKCLKAATGSISALLLLLLHFALASCGNHNYADLPLNPDGTPIENPGRLVVGSSGLPEGAVASLVAVAGSSTLAGSAGPTATAETETDRLIALVSPGQPVDVEAGTYLLRYINPLPEGATLHAALLTLPALGNSGSSSGTELPQAPADLIGGAIPVAIIANRTTEITLTLAPLVRTVQLDAALIGADISAIRSIEASLYGVSRTARLDKGFAYGATSSQAGENAPVASLSSVAYGATSPQAGEELATPSKNRGGARDTTGYQSGEADSYQSEEADSYQSGEADSYYVWTALEATSGSSTADADPVVSGTFCLLGTDSSQPQRLLIVATLTDGSTISYKEDVTSLFAAFNPPAANTALHLAATLNFGINEVTGTIEPWKPGWNEGGTGM